MARRLWTLLKNGNKVNVLGYDAALEWRNNCEDLKSLVTSVTTFKFALADPNQQVITLSGKNHYWVLARITE
jgi:hypothetical protein